MQRRSNLVVAVVMVALDRRIVARAVYPIELPVGSEMVCLGNHMLDIVLAAVAIEDVLTIVDVFSA